MLIVGLGFALLTTTLVWINLICCKKTTSKACFCFGTVCKDLGERWLSFALIFINIGVDFRRQFPTSWEIQNPKFQMFQTVSVVVLLPKWHTHRTPGEAGKCREIGVSELEIRD